MSDMFIPHKYNSTQKQHPSYAVQILEEIAIDAFSRYTQDLEKIFNINIKYFFESDGKKHTLAPVDMGAGYGFLPTILVLHTQKHFLQVFLTDEYPIGIIKDPNGSAFFSYVPTIKNGKNFASFLNVLDFSIEDYINKSLVKTLLPLHNNAPFFTIKDNKLLQDCLFEVIKKHTFKEVGLSLNDDLENFQKLIKKTIYQSNDMDVKQDAFQPIEADLVSLYESIHQQHEAMLGRAEDRLTIRFADENEYNGLQKPETPSSKRYEQFVYDEERDIRKRINTGDNDGKSSNVYYGI